MGSFSAEIQGYYVIYNLEKSWKHQVTWFLGQVEFHFPVSLETGMIYSLCVLGTLNKQFQSHLHFYAEISI